MSFGGGGGFNFAKSTAPAAGAGAFSLATSNTQPNTLLGAATAATTTKAQTPGFNFGQQPTAAPTQGFTLGQQTTAAPTQGFTLGQQTTAAPTQGFTLGQQATSTAATSGFNFGTPAASSASTGFTLGTTPAQPTAGVVGLGGTTTAAGTGLFGTPSTTPAAGFGFSTPVQATPSVGSSAIGLGGLSKPGLSTAAFTTTGTGQALKLGATTAGLTVGLGTTGTSGSIFNQAAVKTTATGLGGVDPKTTTSLASTTGDGTKASEGKTIKEQMVENEILVDIEAFKKFVKDEKTEEEHIKRLSSTPMIKVQEDNIALRQLLSVVASGLQRNACAVDKLKREMTQELKNAEMAHRTKDIPVGLQYENTAPTHYFQGLVESFENQMLTYRQQIEMLESHLSSLHQPNRLTSDELVLLLRKLHEAFVAMAAQLQQVHEAVKTQKEQYLNYRKVFLGDGRNIFERQKKAPVKVTTVHHTDYGQSPFPGVQDAAATAMASALNRSQQPQSQTGAPPITGFAQSTGFGTGSSGYGGFGSNTSTGLKGFGGTGLPAGGGTSLFGNTSNLATTQSAGIINSSFPAPGTNQPALNLSTSTEQPFQLNKPPVGSKRGKR